MRISDCSSDVCSSDLYEVGVKYVSPDRRLLLTGALFDVRQSNQARYDQTIDLIDRYAPIGKVRHRGIELQAVGEIAKGWQVNAGLSILDPTIRRDDDAALIRSEENTSEHQSLIRTSYAAFSSNTKIQ